MQGVSIYPLGYRYQWWSIAGTDAYLALGLQGQFIYIDPSTDTVVVKLSYFPRGNDEAEVESPDFLRVASQWRPKRSHLSGTCDGS